MQEAMKIWQTSDQDERLEGLANDPVFSVIMTALAYQANDTDNQIEQLKDEVIEEFNRSLSTGSSGHAIPSIITVCTAPSGPQPVELDENSVFTSNSGSHEFIPIIKSKVFRIKESKVDRIDGRRWRVTLTFPEPITSIDGMTIAFTNQPYHDLKMTMMINGEEKPVDIIKPWEASEMPLTEPFGLDTLLYNRTNMVTGGGARGNLSPYNSQIALEMFARHDLNLFYIRKSPMNKLMDSVTLIFEFEGVGKNFTFNISTIAINTTILANVKIKTVTLSGAAPMARVSGVGTTEQFLYLLRPDRDQMFASAPLMVRKVNVDRFNRARFTKMLQNIIARYKSDYYAFMSAKSQDTDAYISRIIESLQALQAALGDDDTVSSGVYVMLQRMANFEAMAKMSLSARYLVTNGSKASSDMDINTKFTVPGGIDAAETNQILPPDPGVNEIRDEQYENSLRKYTLVTNDRLVTPYDLKVFCYSELQTRYNIVRELIKDINVKHERYDQASYHTYCIKVVINLTPNAFVKRAFDGKIEEVEAYLERMMKVKSTQIYPIKVKINM